MVVVSVVYPASSRFDLDYYMRSHMKLVRERWSDMGLQEARLLRGTYGPDGSAAPYALITLLTFGSAQQFQAAVAKHGAELLGDIKNFTDAQPVLQLNEPVAV
jgi:uncharacterized protein (TIGR02118 family)